jgi:hypothetical protein
MLNINMTTRTETTPQNRKRGAVGFSSMKNHIKIQKNTPPLYLFFLGFLERKGGVPFLRFLGCFPYEKTYRSTTCDLRVGKPSGVMP